MMMKPLLILALSLPSPALPQTPVASPQAPGDHVHTAPAKPGDVLSCPMHPEVRSAQAGKCPKCGMALVAPKPETAPPAITGPKLTLADLERMALGQNPIVGQAQALVDAASGRTQQAGLWPNPSFGANGEHVSKVTGGGAIGGFVEQRFITSGKLGLDRKIAQQDQAQSVQMQSAQRQRLLNAVRTLYYQALGDQRLLDVRRELVVLATRAVAVSRELANVGQADRPDLLAAETEAERIELELVSAQNAQQRTWRQMAALVNQPQLKPAPLEGDLESVPQLDAEQALDTIYRDSPELRAAEVAVRRSEFSVRRAEVDRVPDIFVRGGLRNNREFGEVGPFGPTRRRGLEGIFDVSVQIPIFNRNQGGVKAAKAEATHARLAVDHARLSLQARLAAEYKDYQDSRIAVERYKTRILPKARQAYDLYLSNFRAMAGAYPQALIAQRNLFQLQDSYIAALVNTWHRAVQIEGLLLGSGLEMSTSPAATSPSRDEP
ncbi:MAG: TolC family protein [Bryobacteraceae bacterium]|nr:TolC family protein [Bryobacteraceae bacterium]